MVSGIEYEAARAGGFMGYKLICDWEGVPVRHEASGQIPRWTDPRWNGYLANLSPSLFRARYESRLAETMTGVEYLRNGQVHVDPFTRMRLEVTYRVRACGTVAVLGRKDARPAFDRVVSRYAAARGITPYVFEGSSMGADRFGIKTLEA